MKKTLMLVGVIFAAIMLASEVSAQTNNIEKADAVGQAFGNLIELRSASYTSDSSLWAQQGTQYISASINSYGKFNTNINNPQASIVISGQVKSSDIPTTSGQIGFRITNKKAYAIVYNLLSSDPSIKKITGSGALLNRWIDLGEATRSYSQEINPQQALEFKLGARLILNNLIQSGAIVINELPGQYLSGVQTKHYVITMNNAAMKKALLDIATKYSGSRIDVNSSKQDIDAFVDAIRQLQMDMWVGTYDNIPRKISVAVSGTVENATFSVNSNMTFSNINKPVSVLKPVYSTPLEKFMQNIYSLSKVRI